MANKNFTVKNGLEVGGQEVISSSGAITSAALGGQVLGTSASPSFANITTAGYLRGPASFVIDPAAHGDDTGTVVIAGNLQVDGTQTTINSTTMTVDDLNLTLASGAANAAAANGAGITVDITGATNPSLVYGSSNDDWTFNKNLNVTGNIAVTGAATMDGLTVGSATSQNGVFDTVFGSGDANEGIVIVPSTTGKGWVGFNNGNNSTIPAQLTYNFSSSLMELYSSGSLNMQTGAASRLNIADNGDISFYNAAGTDAKMFWDASGESLSIGTTGSGTDRRLQISSTNPSTATTQYGIVANPTMSNDVTGSIYNIYSQANVASGASLTNLYSVYIGASGLNSSTVTNVYGLYQAGASEKNYFAGNVGIGTDAPKTTLNLASSISGQGPILTLENTDTSITTGDVIGQIDFYANDGSTNGTGAKVNIKAVADSTAGTVTELTFGTSPSSSATAIERVRIDASGNVGIGTTNPSRLQYGSVDPKLHVDQGWVTGSYNLTARFSAGGDENNTGASILINHSNDRGLLIEAGREMGDTGIAHFGIVNSGGTNTRLMTLKQGGNVGIGTTTPHGKLQFASDVNTRKIVLYEGADNDYQFYGFGVEAQTLVYSTYQPTDDHVFFSGASTTSRNELMRITGDGKVGIGTDAPGFPLDVSASIGSTIGQTSTHGYSSNRNWAMRTNNYGSANWGGWSLEQSTSAGGAPTVARIGVHLNGNVGINMGGDASTSLTDKNPATALHVGGDITVGSADSVGTGGTASIRFQNDNERSRITSNYASGGGGQMGFWTDTTGGSLIQRMTIRNSGIVTMPYQPAFKAAWASRAATGSGRILSTNASDTVTTGRDEFNTGSHFDAATGKFTAPVAGTYLLGFQAMRHGNDGASLECRIKKNGALMWARAYQGAFDQAHQYWSIVTTTKCAVGDYFQVYIGPSTSIYNDDTYFYGHLIG